MSVWDYGKMQRLQRYMDYGDVHGCRDVLGCG